MSYFKVVRRLCGLAGGSAVLVAAAAAVYAESRDSSGEKGGEQRTRRWGAIGSLYAAQKWRAGTDETEPKKGGWDTNWDRREPAFQTNGKKRGTDANDIELFVENKKPKATRHILLIRHSQYNLNGHSDKDRTLTGLGQEQAELTGQRLATLGLKYDVLIHSSMTRAVETANIISKYIPGIQRVSCDLLREGAPIEPDPPINHWKPDSVQYYEDGARIEAAFRRYIHRAETNQLEDTYEIIICHANVIRYFVCRALQFPSEGWLRMGLNHGSITWLTIRPSGRVILRTLGDSGFMPPEKVTRS
ncbi:serine/threonine-protein phosphatase PGAM5, mitochondrial isoform X1 [Erpetoichthys calabaricus]|uniref:Serine/threonine-protein phosphatase PGAM5, mitochondrial n=1 Tax=Erpetoichthys calabaricus TaxID=27687 RepID=A0A8C4TFE6_ERPCA|nr:serine/threonine-protein phosphatase PGAM5, mitochondrial isoform X1 [Erpetoichthys calabaricus]